ncbi:energy transducer TonB [Sphingomonas aliaeris]|uniref:Energy transducer TonB n=1 Tax=Sphingomonas aliaeris TaxID=2759526 RepID=A0A974NT73_9SPHN|nr:energy transducer TonB [Sphingomonas aliaeris]QQV76471.1 energy transducer TonB [Sphingomonas aliaeris]
MQKMMRVVLLVLSGVSSTGLIAQTRATYEMPKSDFGGAVPKNPGKWLTFEDYPTAAIRNNEQGFVVVNFDITANGKVSRCEVTRSSGHTTLDDVPCRLLQRRARFDPATDASGVAVATRGTASFPFRIP